MSGTNSDSLSTKHLIFVPAILSLAVTLLRLVGELEHWSKTLFNPEVGGLGALVGITWLAPIFGMYFAIRLAGREGPRSALRAIGFGLLGGAIIVGSFPVQRLVLPSPPSFQARLIYIWAMTALAGLVTVPGWPRLWKTLLAYAYAARIPVVIIMFFAFRGAWGTHYDALPPDFTGTSLMSKWLWLGFFPQLILWVGFTLASGILFGSITLAVTRLFRPAHPPLKTTKKAEVSSPIP
ncbi:MAG TPA: hypothetical protein VMG63_18860 [Terriglobia bacterium]|jgi:hypothetical protein|nr:hypothetical protein [Terriglobia bacterium]